jgi:hypothetical protein
MDITCHHCGAIHWLFEKLANNTLANLLFDTCCHKGKIIFPLLQQQPHMLQQMFDENDVRAKKICDHICRYNNAFTFHISGHQSKLHVGT